MKIGQIARFVGALHGPDGRVILPTEEFITDNKIRFGVFEIRRNTRELRKQGVRIKLEDQPFDLLTALIEKPGEIVTRGELQARLWPEGTFVDFDKSLTKAVNKIRTALNDSAVNPRFIETQSRRGYRFIAPVTATEEPLAAPAPESTPAATGKTMPGRHNGLIGTLAAAAIAALLAVSWGLDPGGVRERLTGFKPASGMRSLAVLPIENLTGDPAQQYFADGLTDDLISDLARIGSLGVISYTSAMRYKGARRSLPEIARELRVEGVVEGSLQRAGGRLRINIKLVHAATDHQLWAESYQGDAGAAEQLEGQIVLAVAHQISARLTAETTARMTGARPANSRAYEAYLRGRSLWNLRGRDAITQAATYFEQAVRDDPHFALAWSGLADCYSIGWQAKFDPALAEEYARKALALDPSLAEAHVSLAFAQHCQFRWAAAASELKRGMQLNPNYVPGHQFYALHLLTLGRLVEALAENDRALQLDPFSLPVNNLRGYILVGLRQYDRALAHLQKTAEIDPRSSDPLYQLALLYWLQQRTEDALAWEQRARSAEGRAPGQVGVEAAFAKLGFRAACLRAVQLKEREYPGGSPENIPLQYGCLKDGPKVLEWLERLIAAKEYGTVIQIKTAPEYDFLRSDARFQELVRRIGLPP